MTPQDKRIIEFVLMKYNIDPDKCTINDDGSVDVDSDVNLYNKRLIQIPINFNIVSGCFIIANNRLTSLKGCPKYVGNEFLADNNNIDSLQYAPYIVGGSAILNKNNIKSFNGSTLKRVGDNFLINNNKIESLEGMPEYVGSSIDLGSNKLQNLKGCIDINYDLFLDNNEINTLKYFPDIKCGDVTIIGNDLPFDYESLGHDKFKYIIKNQNDYKIWNNDGSLNKERFNILIDEMND